MELKRISVILDKPKHDQLAWRQACQMQTYAGARMEALSFLWNVLCEPNSTLQPGPRKQLRQQLTQERKTWLSGQVDGTPEVRQRVVWSSNIAAWMAADQAQNPTDLVVKSVHKSQSLVHTPTDWALLNQCTAPLLLAAPRRHKPSGNVLAALDLRHNDAAHRRLNRKVLAAAHALAQWQGGQVHVVFAIEVSRVLRDLDIIKESVSRDKIIAAVTPEMQRLLQPYAIPKSRIHMPVGKVGPVVAQVARKLKADQLVVGSYAHRARGMLGLGNSAQRILTKAVCSVLAVHP